MSEQNIYQPPVTRNLESDAGLGENPHSAGLQALGMMLSSLPLAILGGWLMVISGCCVFADAWYAGIFKRPGKRTFLNISPMGWGIVVQWLFIIGFPLYIIFRSGLKTRPGKSVYFVLTVVFGGLTIAMMALFFFWAWSGALPGQNL